MKKLISLCSVLLLSVVLLSACDSKPSLTKLAPLPVPTDKVVPATKDTNFFSSDDPVWGDAKAPISMIVFSDFQCPFCGKFAEELNGVESDWIITGKLKIQYRDFPLSIHKNSLSAHVAAAAANRQGKYWEFHQRLYREQSAWEKLETPSDYLLGIAKDLGLDLDKFIYDYKDPAIIAEITADRDDGRRTGLEGTPAFLMNGTLYQGVPTAEELVASLKAIKL